MKRIYVLASICMAFFAMGSCSRGEDDKVYSILFSVDDDISLGWQVVHEIESDPDVEVLHEDDYPYVYSRINRIKDSILASGYVQYRYEFPWRLRIIKNDTVLNAFCAPGGFIYIYTGLIKYLDSEDHLAGVIGHEMAHADRRHVIRSMEQQYGLALLWEVVFGENQGALTDIAKGLVSLSFSRKHEQEADVFSVIYLCHSEYQSNGAAGFFRKLLSSGMASGPAFLSTHPSSESRVTDLDAESLLRGCDTIPSGNNYTLLKASLP